jgi:ABC-type transport system involved in cytochrome bd biosynthesis fused ATPase/permease subunit
LVGEQGRHLSGGERQKIVLARAFVRHPQILILDEPTTGLDRQTTEEFLELVAQIHKQGMTIIFITHEFSQLVRFDRIYQLTPEKNVVELAEIPAASPAAQEDHESLAGH